MVAGLNEAGRIDAEVIAQEQGEATTQRWLRVVDAELRDDAAWGLGQKLWQVVLMFGSYSFFEQTPLYDSGAGVPSMVVSGILSVGLALAVAVFLARRHARGRLVATVLPTVRGTAHAGFVSLCGSVSNACGYPIAVHSIVVRVQTGASRSFEVVLPGPIVLENDTANQMPLWSGYFAWQELSKDSTQDLTIEILQVIVQLPFDQVRCLRLRS